MSECKEYVNSPLLTWKSVQGFESLPVPLSFLKNDFVLLDLKNKFNGNIAFLRLPKRCFYNWHVDLYRSAVINSVIEGFDSYTLFTEAEDLNGTSFEVSELVYKEKECYLLDVQCLHAVYNRLETRTFFSLWFEKSITYSIVYNYCLNQGYLIDQ